MARKKVPNQKKPQGNILHQSETKFGMNAFEEKWINQHRGKNKRNVRQWGMPVPGQSPGNGVKPKPPKPRVRKPEKPARAIEKPVKRGA